MDIDESGIKGHWASGNATYSYQWSAFEGSVELPDGFLFFQNAFSFVRIPKSSLNPEDEKQIRLWAHLEAN